MADIEEVITGDTSELVEALDAAAEAAEACKKAIDGVREALEELDAASESLDETAAEADDATASFEEMDRAADEARDAVAEIGEASSGIDAASAAAQEAAGSLAEMDERADAARDAVAEIGAASAGIDAVGASADAATPSFEALAEAEDQARDAAAELAGSEGALAGSESAAAAAADQETAALTAQAAALKAAKDEFAALGLQERYLAAMEYKGGEENIAEAAEADAAAVAEAIAVARVQHAEELQHIADQRAAMEANFASGGSAADLIGLPSAEEAAAAAQAGTNSDFAFTSSTEKAAAILEKILAENESDKLDELVKDLSGRWSASGGLGALQAGLAAGQGMSEVEDSVTAAKKALAEADPLIDQSAHLLDGADAAAQRYAGDLDDVAAKIEAWKAAARNFTETAAAAPEGLDPASFAAMLAAEAEMDAAAADVTVANETAAESYARLRDESLEAGAAVQAAAAEVDAAAAEEDVAGGAGDGAGLFSGLLPGLSDLKTPAVIAGIGGLIGGLAPALLTAGAGFVSFAALAFPALDKVEKGLSAVDTAQTAYNTAVAVQAKDPTAANLTAQQKALATLKAAWSTMPAPVAAAVTAIQGFEHAWSKAGKASGIQQDALHDIAGAAKFGQALIPSFVSLAQEAAKTFDGTFSNLIADIKAPAYKNFISSMKQQMSPDLNSLQRLFASFGGFFARLTEQGAKVSPAFINSLATMLKTTTPAAVSGLLDLAKDLTHVANAITDVTKAAEKSPLDKVVRDTVGAGEAAIRGVVHTAEGLNLFNTHGQDHIPSWLRDFSDAKFRAVAKVSVVPELNKAALDKSLSVTGGMPPVKIPVEPKFNKAAFDATTLKQGILAAAGPAASGAKVPVAVRPQVSGDDMQQSMDSAARNVKLHGVTVDLSNARLAGLSALSGTMSKAGQQAGQDLDKAIASAIRSGAAAAVSDARNITTQVKSALEPLASAGRSIGAALGAGLAAGIAAGTGAAVAAAASMASQVEAAARTRLQTQSPSKVFAKIGAETVAGFVLGLEGGRAQVRAAMALVLGHAVSDLSITTEIAKLKTEVEAALKAGVISTAQDSAYTAYIRADNKRLQHLATERDSLESEIRAADALSLSVKNAAISAGSVTSAFGETFAGKNAAAGGATYTTINKALKAQLGETRAFRADIEKLKKEGLDKNSIKALLAAGVSGGLPEAEELLASGKKGVRETAHLEQEIARAARRLGITGANAAYESGSQIGKGLAEGLRSQLGKIVAEMKRVGEELVAAIKRALRISSPSQVMHQIGNQAGQGLVDGIAEYEERARSAMERLSGGAVASPGFRPASAGGYGGVSTTVTPLHQEIVVVLNGKQLGRAVQTVQLQHAHRNTGTGNQSRGRGT